MNVCDWAGPRSGLSRAVRFVAVIGTWVLSSVVYHSEFLSLRTDGWISEFRVPSYHWDAAGTKGATDLSIRSTATSNKKDPNIDMGMLSTKDLVEAAGTAIEFDPSIPADNHVVGNDEHKDDNSTYFIVAAGRGTSGTHAIFKATCRMGYPSIHWTVQCGTLPMENTTSTTTPAQLQKMKEARNAHLRVMALTKMAEFCIYNETQTHCGSAILWQRELLTALRDLVTTRVVYALHDSPYPSLLSRLIPLIRQTYGHDRLFVLLSERDPSEYVKRRVSKSYGRNDLVCKPEYAQPFDPKTLDGGLLDWMACIDQAAKAGGPSKAPTLDLKDVLWSLSYQVERVENGQQLLVDAAKEWQDAVRDLSDYNVNLFDRPNPTSKKISPKVLVEEMASSRIPYQNDEQPTTQVDKESYPFLPPPVLYEYYGTMAEKWAAFTSATSLNSNTTSSATAMLRELVPPFR